MIEEAPVLTRPALAGGGRWLLPIAIAAAIVAWQLSFNSASIESRRDYAMTASMGLCADAPLFFYFFHHFGLFPVGAREVPQLGASKPAAEAFVAQHGDRLRMDFGWPTNTPRFGDYGKLFLFYPDLLLRNDPAHPSTIPCNELLFIVALLAVFWAFWREGHGLLGTLIVLFVGSNPFQLLETYGRGNIFSLPISVALLALAAHVSFLTRRAPIGRSAWWIAAASGVALATFREVRAEAAIIGVSALASYLVARAPWRQRVALVAVFVLSAALTASAWSRFWTGEFTRSEAFVARSGGQVLHAPPGQHHAFWHAVFCGLGDYGADRGFAWDDRVPLGDDGGPGEQFLPAALPLQRRLLPGGDVRRRAPHLAHRPARVQPARARARAGRDRAASRVVRRHPVAACDRDSTTRHARRALARVHDARAARRGLAHAARAVVRALAPEPPARAAHRLHAAAKRGGAARLQRAQHDVLRHRALGRAGGGDRSRRALALARARREPACRLNSAPPPAARCAWCARAATRPPASATSTPS
jgi:hypothetical protein